MPFVSVRIVEGQSKERKDEMARRITEAIVQVAGVPGDAVWVTFHDHPADEWYIGSASVAELRKRASATDS